MSSSGATATTSHVRTGERAAGRWGARLYWLGVSWFVLTGLGWCFIWLAWNPPLDGAESARLPAESLLKGVANVFQAFTAPVWLATWWVVGKYQDWRTVLACNGAGWGLWALVAAAVMHASDVLWARRMRSSAARRAEAAARADVAVDLVVRSRREFLLGSAGAAGAVSVLGLTARATTVATHDLRVRRYSVDVRDLPAELDGLRVAQLADTHLGPRVSSEYIERAVSMTLAEKPDVVALVGDYVHMGSWYTKPAAELFAPLARPGAVRFGAIAVLGNHDHYAGASEVAEALARIGCRLVVNSNVYLDAAGGVSEAAPARGVCIAGVGDFIEDIIDVRASLRGVPERMARIMLCHNPDAVDAGRFGRALEGSSEGSARIDLMLCGHTHGGQVVVPGVGPVYRLVRERTRWLGLYGGPPFTVLVTAGVGVSIVPIRTWCPPEIVMITLRAV